MIYSFTLVLNRKVTEDEADALCGLFPDGTVETGRDETRIYFDREAPSLDGAVASARADVTTVPGLRVLSGQVRVTWP